MESNFVACLVTIKNSCIVHGIVYGRVGVEHVLKVVGKIMA